MKDLINRFNRFKPDSKLIKSLETLNRHRNKIVHKEFISVKNNRDINLRELDLIRLKMHSEGCCNKLENLLINTFEKKT